MPGRSWNAVAPFRYGFNGKENDNEVKGVGDQQDYGMRIYDPRVGRFLSVDPLTGKYPELTPYQFASNRPIDGVDQDGKEYSPAGLNINPVTGVANPRSTTAAVTMLNPAQLAAAQKAAADQAYQDNLQILDVDNTGKAYIGPQKIVREQIAGANIRHATEVGDNVRSGAFGSAGYLFDGERGAAIGANIDGVMLSTVPNAFPDEYSSAFPQRKLSTNEPDVPNMEAPITFNVPDFSQVVRFGAFSNFRNLDELASQFKGRNLDNSVNDLLGNGWVSYGQKNSKTMFEKIVGKVRYYATWEPTNLEHSNDGKPASYWKLTVGKPDQSKSSGNSRRVGASSNFKDD